MSSTLLETASSLREEATRILDGRGLRSTLESFGRLVVHGSHALDLMVWRDLDLYLVPMASLHDPRWFFELGSRVANLLKPFRMSFRDETRLPGGGLPKGLYWGVYFSECATASWKIDIWAVDGVESSRLLGYQSWVAERLNPESRQKIMEIKAAVHLHPEYRRSFGAKEVYDAVLTGGISGTDAFWDHLGKVRIMQPKGVAGDPRREVHASSAYQSEGEKQ